MLGVREVYETLAACGRGSARHRIRVVPISPQRDSRLLSGMRHRNIHSHSHSERVLPIIDEMPTAGRIARDSEDGGMGEV